MWRVEYIDHTFNNERCKTTASNEELESMFKHDAGGVITLKHWEEIKMKIEIMQVGVDLKNGRYTKVAFTGHRPSKTGGYDRDNPTRVMIRTKLDEVCTYLIQNCYTDEFMEGGAQGIDQDAGDVILNIIRESKEESNGTPICALHAAIPFPGQERLWPKEGQDYYRNQLKDIADQDRTQVLVDYVHTTTPKTKWDAVKWLDDRNHHMINWCDLLIAIWDGTLGGTKNAIDYAKKVGKPILLLKLS